MSRELINLIVEATGESLFMVAVAALLGTLSACRSAIFLATSRKGELFAAPVRQPRSRRDRQCDALDALHHPGRRHHPVHPPDRRHLDRIDAPRSFR